MRVKSAQGGESLDFNRPRVVLVENSNVTIIDDEARVADGPVSRSNEAMKDHLHPVQLQRFPVPCLYESMEAQVSQRGFQKGKRVVGQENRSVLGHPVSKEDWVEVVVVEMRDVEVRGLLEPPEIEAFIARKWKP